MKILQHFSPFLWKAELTVVVYFLYSFQFEVKKKKIKNGGPFIQGRDGEKIFWVLEFIHDNPVVRVVNFLG